MFPAAPVRFSITTGWPHLRDSHSPTIRGIGVGRSSGRKWHDDFDGAVRIVIGQRRGVTMRGEGQKQRQDAAN